MPKFYIPKKVLIKRAKAGGQARGWQERKEALLRYHLSPHHCKFCGGLIAVGNRRVADVIKKKFCNSSHAAAYNNAQRRLTNTQLAV
jgi:hypothetical protein